MQTCHALERCGNRMAALNKGPCAVQRTWNLLHSMQHSNNPPSLILAAAGEDMWHAYNLIREGDQVTATTFRKVQQETSKGSDSERVKIRLTIHVEHVDFDPDGEGWAACMGTHGGVCAAPAVQAMCLHQCPLIARLAQE